MSERLYVQADMWRITKLHSSAPSLFFMLTECMGEQPTIDPDAGYGVFQVPTLYFNISEEEIEGHEPWTEEFGDKLAKMLGPYPEKFYVLIRGVYACAVTRKEVEEFVAGQRELDFKHIYEETRKLVPTLGKPGIMELLG